ncbi:MAG: EamA family transporter [Frankiales bacterium]|nr:EamA family transporter [Frankiales bacterium]
MPLHRPGTRVWLALWVVYIVWGSTYLAIRVGVHPSSGTGLPPLLLAGARFTLAGALMLAFTVRRPAADGRPDPLGRRQWAAAAVIGLALLLGGNGLVSIAEQRVASGLAAVVIATVPIWAALLGAAWGQEPVSRRHAAGLVLGFAGVAALVVGTGGGKADVTGVLTAVGAALSWAAGSVWSRTAPTVRRPLVMTGMEMLCGGIGCFLVGIATGEVRDVHLAAVPAQTWVASGYLVVAGSMLAYTAYVWLLHNARLSLVTTYAYVNPLVAVVLGALVLHEHPTVRTAVATATIIAGVGLMVSRPASAPQPGQADAAADENDPDTTLPSAAEPARCR